MYDFDYLFNDNDIKFDYDEVRLLWIVKFDWPTFILIP